MRPCGGRSLSRQILLRNESLLGWNVLVRNWNEPPYLVLYEDSPIIVKLLKTFSCLEKERETSSRNSFFSACHRGIYFRKKRSVPRHKKCYLCRIAKAKKAAGAPVLPCVMHLPIREMEMLCNAHCEKCLQKSPFYPQQYMLFSHFERVFSIFV